MQCEGSSPATYVVLLQHLQLLPALATLAECSTMSLGRCALRQAVPLAAGGVAAPLVLRLVWRASPLVAVRVAATLVLLLLLLQLVQLLQRAQHVAQLPESVHPF